MESVDFFPIDIEQTSWSASSEPLSKLRNQVFIKEQGVPEDEEFDGADANAIHWITYGPRGKGPEEQAIGCARLCGNKIGRMAVAHGSRNRGVGSALVRRIIQYASRNGMESLQLNAQTHAIPFYEGMYFQVEGDEFVEAGIPHRHMTLLLKRFTDPKVTPPPPDIAAEERERIVLDNAASFKEQAKKLVEKAHRQISIFSNQLDPRIYDNEELYRLMMDFARERPHSEIHILVKDPHFLVQTGHRLLHLFHRLPSRVQIRTLGKEIKTLHSEFMLVDRSGILYNQSGDRYGGYAIPYAPFEAVELLNDFDDMWEHSEPDPELRQLPV
ncbi:MAG: hypothetical protein DRR06_01125 [Gammaproteobacteria bacterium]|nr:MAG: hypothetical protein DRR06_01125 [Gammaproteobacteria bacterium]RLA54923.1 MAG: hypothetical protein DRR42_00010 [Gammaproteobacteria bacterium]